MKKLILMLLVFSLVLCLPGCIGKGATIKNVCEIASNAAPTKIVTTVTLITNSGDKLSGFYETVTDGTNVIFTYSYQRLNTPAESVESGNYDRVLTETGVINYKDGVYFSGDLETWRPGTGTAFDLKLNFDRKLFKKADVLVDENGNKQFIPGFLEEHGGLLACGLYQPAGLRSVSARPYQRSYDRCLPGIPDRY